MATAPSISQARLFAQLLSELEPEIRRAFMASVTDLQAGVDWTALLDSLTRGDTQSAITALHIDPAAWSEYSSAMTAAYAKAGASTAAQIQAQGIGGIGTRFQMMNPRAEAWIRENVGESITGYVREQVDTARKVIEAGYARGEGPRTIATDLVGRSDRGSARTGGVLGLDGPRAERLMRVTEGMRSPEGVRSLVIEHQDGTISMRYQVNKATEARIMRAYRAGTEVPASDRAISERQYSNALLKARGETVARTETGSAVMSGRMESWMQLVDSQGISPDSIIKTWRHGGGLTKDYRPSHVAMNGKSVRGLFTPFIIDGTPLQYACDPKGGARQVINCRCSCEFRVDVTAGLS